MTTTSKSPARFVGRFWPLFLSVLPSAITAFVPPPPPSFQCTKPCHLSEQNEWKSDFDDFVSSSSSSDSSSSSSSSNFFLLDEQFRAVVADRSATDLSACRQRQFVLGEDLVLMDFAGSMGFDEVTDWEYYYYPEEEEEDGDSERRVVQPSPLDPSTPKRTRVSSGSVVRLFRGELQGRLGNVLRSRGLDRRVLVKEFSGELALSLARSELESIGTLQSHLVTSIDDRAKEGEWVKTASARSVSFRKDDANVATLVQNLQKELYTGILGEVNLAELEDNLEPNEFYRALGVQPPKLGAVWIVYEYTGLATVAAYSKPALQRRASLPLKRGLFGNPLPPESLPPWKERANYVIKGIMRGALEAVARVHDAGIAHRSIGRSSVVLSSVAMDKTEASSAFATLVSRLVMKLSDFGFSGPLEYADDDLLSRARKFGVTASRRDTDTIRDFAIAEDLHALGFVFLGLLLTSLAEIPAPEYNLPATDDDTLQRLLGDIFEKDMEQFREYVEAEEIWSKLVELLDEKDGWDLLASMCFARERVGEKEPMAARELLESPLFQK